ncbi:MAG: NADH-quinone oxidoreductase subunit C [bacterium]|nr:NADH-quinone oxidoreductase subunit C [bacterium]
MQKNWVDWLKQKLEDVSIHLEDSVLSSEKAIFIQPTDLLRVATILRTDPEAKFDFLHSITGIDLKSDLLAVYHIYAISRNERIILKVKIPKDHPMIDSVAHLWPSADWHEREAFDLVGILFHNHPDLRRILLPDDWEGHPLRKDYVPPDYYGEFPVPANLKDRIKRPTN